MVFSRNYRETMFRIIRRFNGNLSTAISSLVGVDVSSTPSKQDIYFEEILNALRSSGYANDATSLSLDAEKRIEGLFADALRKEISFDVKNQIQSLIDKSFGRKIENISAQFLIDTKNRLRSASSTVTIRGLLNLVIGIGFAIWALAILREAVSVFTPSQLTGINVNSIIYVSALRVSLGVVIVVISYFFLSLYRRSMDESKFYQNEITTISALLSALNLAHSSDSESVKAYVVSRLMEYDRNSLDVVGRNRKVTIDPKLSSEIIKSLIDKVPTIKTV